MPPADLEEGYLRARTLDSEHVFLARRTLPLLKMRAHMLDLADLLPVRCSLPHIFLFQLAGTGTHTYYTTFYLASRGQRSHCGISPASVLQLSGLERES